MRKNKMLTYALYAGAAYAAYKYFIEPGMASMTAPVAATAKTNGSGIVQDNSGLGLIPPGYGPQFQGRGWRNRGGWGQRQIDGGGGGNQPSSIFTENNGQLPTYNE